MYMCIYIYMVPPPQSPHLSCSGGITSKVNSSPLSRVTGFASISDVVTERSLDLYSKIPTVPEFPTA